MYGNPGIPFSAEGCPREKDETSLLGQVLWKYCTNEGICGFFPEILQMQTLLCIKLSGKRWKIGPIVMLRDFFLPLLFSRVIFKYLSRAEEEDEARIIPPELRSLL